MAKNRLVKLPEPTSQERLNAAVTELQAVLDKHKMSIVVVGFKLNDGRLFPEVHLQPITPPEQLQPKPTNQQEPT